MDHVEVAIKMLQSKIDVIEFCSMAYEKRVNMNTMSRNHLTCSLEACGCFAKWLDIRHSAIDRGNETDSHGLQRYEIDRDETAMWEIMSGFQHPACEHEHK